MINDNNGTVGLKGAMEILQVSEHTLRRWRNKGHIAFIKKPSGQVLYRVEDLRKVYER